MVEECIATVKRLMVPGKGVLAADESNPSADKRFVPLGITPSGENRRRWRELLFTTPEIEKYVSGIILYNETIRQSTASGTSFAQLLQQKGIIPGIKVDGGLEDFGQAGEQSTKGIGDLAQRLGQYPPFGASFTKWRSVFKVGLGLPSAEVIKLNTDTLAQYARLSQQTGMVPFVEPEVLLAGSHSLAEAEEATGRVLEALFAALAEAQVALPGLILKTSMALPGSDSTQSASIEEVAQATVKVLRDHVPAEVGGVVFLSGGQSTQAATEHLNAIAQLGPHSWPVSFSFSRALQDPVLKHWGGDDAKASAAQQIFIGRLQATAAATLGQYNPSLEPDNLDAAASDSQS